MNPKIRVKIIHPIGGNINWFLNRERGFLVSTIFLSGGQIDTGVRIFDLTFVNTPLSIKMKGIPFYTIGLTPDWYSIYFVTISSDII